MLPLITTALGALLWLLHASLGQDPAAMAGGFPWTWIKPLAMGVTALAVGHVSGRGAVAAPTSSPVVTPSARSQAVTTAPG